MPIGPANTVHPTSALDVGSPGVGSLLVDGGLLLQLARLPFGSNVTTEPSAASCSYAGFNSRTFCIATEAAAVRVSTPSFS